MPRYFVEIKHRTNGWERSAKIEHCNIDHFIESCAKKKWDVVGCTKLNDRTSAIKTASAAQ